MKTLFSTIKGASHQADKKQSKERTPYSVLASIASELGELAEEIAIKQGDCSKCVGQDGIIGETVDILVSAIDLIHIVAPNLSEREITKLAEAKCKKWIKQTK